MFIVVTLSRVLLVALFVTAVMCRRRWRSLWYPALVFVAIGAGWLAPSVWAIGIASFGWTLALLNFAQPLPKPPTPGMRPRFGVLTHADGTTEPLVFHERAPGLFAALHAGDERAAVLAPGDRITCDEMARGQVIVIGACPEV